MLFLCTGTSTPTWRRCWETSPAAGRSLSDGWNGSLKSRPGTLTSTLSCATRRWRKPAPFMSDISFCCFTNMQDTGNCFPTVKFKQYNKTLKYRNKKRDQGDGLSRPTEPEFIIIRAVFFSRLQIMFSERQQRLLSDFLFICLCKL